MSEPPTSHNGVFDKCKEIFLTQKEHGEFVQATEQRFGRLEGDVRLFLSTQRGNRYILILTFIAVLTDILSHLFLK